MSVAAPQPFATKKRPPSSGMDSVVRFSDVAQFVGLSLLRDPALARPKVKSNKSRMVAKVGAPGTALAAASPLSASLDARTEEVIHDRGEFSSTSEADLSIRSVSAERTDQLRTQLQWLHAERRAEQEELRKLEVSLSDAMLMEKRAHQRAQQHREMRDFHQKRNQLVETKMRLLKDELKAGERAQRQPFPKVKDAVMAVPDPRPYVSGEMSIGSPAASSQVRADQFSPYSPDSAASVSGAFAGMTSASASSSSVGRRPSKKMQQSASAPSVTSADGTPSSNMPRELDTPSAAGTPGHKLADSLQGVVSKHEVETTQRADSKRTPPSALQEPLDVAETGQPSPTLSTPARAIQSPSKKPVSALTMPAPLEEEEDHSNDPIEEKREAVRRKMIMGAGSAKKAFRSLDLNGSGSVCLGDFAGGVSRLGVNWQQLTGFRRPRDLFKLFDTNKDGYLDIYELFPEERNPPPGEPPSTPDFWKTYLHQNRDVMSDAEREKSRVSKWQPENPEEELNLIESAIQTQQEVAFKKKWMKSTIRRLKSRGKSDARCREIVALHLPRGTGPKDREAVGTFSHMEVKQCKRLYNDEVNDPARNIQKELYEMRDQRRILQTSRQKLWSVAMEPHLRHRQEEERKAAAANLGTFSFLGKPKGLDGNKNPEGEAAAAAAMVEEDSTSFNALEKRCENMDVDQIEDVFRVWMKFADKTEVISKHGFVKLLEELSPKRTLSPSDITAWWDQIHRIGQKPQDHAPGPAAGNTDRRASSGGKTAPDSQAPDAHAAAGKRKVASFDKFIVWFSSSEVRSQ